MTNCSLKASVVLSQCSNWTSDSGQVEKGWWSCTQRKQRTYRSHAVWGERPPSRSRVLSFPPTFLSSLSARREPAHHSDPQNPQVFLCVCNSLPNNNTLHFYTAFNFSKCFSSHILSPPLTVCKAGSSSGNRDPVTRVNWQSTCNPVPNNSLSFDFAYNSLHVYYFIASWHPPYESIRQRDTQSVPTAQMQDDLQPVRESRIGSLCKCWSVSLPIRMTPLTPPGTWSYRRAGEFIISDFTFYIGQSTYTLFYSALKIHCFINKTKQVKMSCNQIFERKMPFPPSLLPLKEM